MAKYPYSNDRDLIARGLFVKSNCLLVNQNVNRKTGAAYAALPGGHVDPGEDCRTALWREIEEELDAKAAVGDLLHVSESIYAGRSAEDQSRHELTLLFEGEIWGEKSEGDTVLSPEKDKNFRWLPIADLASANLLPGTIKSFLLEYFRSEPGELTRYAFSDTTK